jgi:uncharacterized membrane protein
MGRTTLTAHGLAIAALTLAAQAVPAQTIYRVVELPIVAGSPVAMDSRGKVLAFNSNGSYYLCGKAACRTLPRVRDGTTHWSDFNELGMLTGYATKPGAGTWAVRKDPQQSGGARLLTPGFGGAIAPDGAVIGTTSDSSAFLYTDHRTELKGLVGPFPEPTDINSHHVIVGRSRGAGQRDHATMWVDGGEPQDLGMAPGHTDSWALAINDAGVAVGSSTDPTYDRQPARFSEGNVKVFLLPHADDSGMARGINSAGTIVGYIRQPSLGGKLVGGVVEGDRMVDLNTRLRREDAGRYDLWDVAGINDAGEIAALHVDPVTHRGRAVRLEPIAGP